MKASRRLCVQILRCSLSESVCGLPLPGFRFISPVSLSRLRFLMTVIEVHPTSFAILPGGSFMLRYAMICPFSSGSSFLVFFAGSSSLATLRPRFFGPGFTSTPINGGEVEPNRLRRRFRFVLPCFLSIHGPTQARRDCEGVLVFTENRKIASRLGAPNLRGLQ